MATQKSDRASEQYSVIIANHHDVRIRNSLTGHEWCIVARYDGTSYEILHRHHARYGFHSQTIARSFSEAMEVIREHDQWFNRAISSSPINEFFDMIQPQRSLKTALR